MRHSLNERKIPLTEAKSSRNVLLISTHEERKHTREESRPSLAIESHVKQGGQDAVLEPRLSSGSVTEVGVNTHSPMATVIAQLGQTTLMSLPTQ